MLKYLFSFHGRVGRGKLWLGMVFLGLIGLVAIFLFPLIDGVSLDVAYDKQSGYRPSPVAVGILTAVIIALNVSALALSVRRCHDRGQSGWWYLLTIIPIVGGLWWLINLGLLPGEKGPNKYGPDPRGRVDAEVFA